MAVTPNTAGGLSTNAAPNPTFSYTVGGTDNVLYLVIDGWSGGADVPTAATYAGIAMTKIADSGRSSAGDFVQIWRLKNPATGANTVSVSVVTPLGNVTRYEAVSCSGADGTTPDGTPATATGTGTALSVTQTGCASGDLVLDGMASDATTASVSMVAHAGRTQIQNAAANGENGANSTNTSPSASQVCDWTNSVSATWALASVVVKAPAGPVTVDQVSVSSSLRSTSRRPAPFKPGLAR